VFLQKYDVLGFSRIFGIILLKKNHGIGQRNCRPVAQHHSMGAVHDLFNPDQCGSTP
jgi:hypothetical protein